MRIPPDLRFQAQQLGLRSWVKDVVSRDDYFATIDEAREMIRRATSRAANPGPGVIDWKPLVTIVAAVLDAEGALEDRVVGGRLAEVNTPEQWLRICEAAAWVILERYECEKILNKKWKA